MIIPDHGDIRFNGKAGFEYRSLKQFAALQVIGGRGLTRDCNLARVHNNRERSLRLILAAKKEALISNFSAREALTRSSPYPDSRVSSVHHHGAMRSR